jgi:hypothetical protein
VRYEVLLFDEHLEQRLVRVDVSRFDPAMEPLDIDRVSTSLAQSQPKNQTKIDNSLLVLQIDHPSLSQQHQPQLLVIFPLNLHAALPDDVEVLPSK